MSSPKSNILPQHRIMNTVFMFNSTSADKPPGKGILETLLDADNIYEKLASMQNWRRMLANSYRVRLEFDEHVWPSVEHYCCGMAFTVDDTVFSKFLVDGEYADFNTSQLKKIMSKHKKNFDDVCEQNMEPALLQKFSDQNQSFKQVLLNTQHATLTHWNRGTTKVTDEAGNKIVPSCFLTRLLERIRHDLNHNLTKNPTSSTDTLDLENAQNNVVIESNVDSPNTKSNIPSSQGLKILTKKEIYDYANFTDQYDPSKNRSVNVLTIYEKTNVIGIRMEQLAMGATSYLSSKELACLKNVKDIAFKEFELRKIPFLICRKFSDNIREYWKLSDLIY